jgi:uncharacterized membrane protein YbaN (DUF454 family)
MIRLLLLLTGWLAVALAMLGVLLPLLPTTPFALIAAGCLARSSPRGHRWLLATPLLGPVLANWQAGRGIPRPAKVAALALMWPSIALATAAATPGSPLRWALPGIALAVTAILLVLPARASAPPCAGPPGEPRPTRQAQT